MVRLLSATLLTGCSTVLDVPLLEGATHACTWRNGELQLAQVIDDGAEDAVIYMLPRNSAWRGTYSVHVTTGGTTRAPVDLETDSTGRLPIEVASLESGNSIVAVGRRGDDMPSLASMGIDVYPAGEPALYCAGAFDEKGTLVSPGFFGEPLQLTARAYMADGLQAEFVVADRDPRIGDVQYQILDLAVADVVDGRAEAEVVPDDSRAQDPLENGGPDVTGWVSLLDAKGKWTGFTTGLSLDLGAPDE